MKFGEGLGVFVFVAFDTMNELLSYFPLLNKAFISSERG
jgi:hypothetical protein